MCLRHGQRGMCVGVAVAVGVTDPYKALDLVSGTSRAESIQWRDDNEFGWKKRKKEKRRKAISG